MADLITFTDKVNNPELLAFLQQYGETEYLTAQQINQMRDAINFLNNKKFDKPNGNSTQYIRGDGSLAAFPSLLPALTAGSVLFSDGTTIAQDNDNLFFNPATKRLGLGTKTPTHKLDVLGAIGSGRDVIKFKSEFSRTGYLSTTDTNVALSTAPNTTGTTVLLTDTSVHSLASSFIQFSTNGSERARFVPSGNLLVGTGTDSGGRLTVRAQGALSTDIAFRVRDSTDALDLLKVRGDGRVGINIDSPASTLHVNGSLISGSSSSSGLFFNTAIDALYISNQRVVAKSGAALLFGNNNSSLSLLTNSLTRLYIDNSGNIAVGATTSVASSKLTIESTTQGFLKPRMTEAQRLAIASPATGLEVYQTDGTEGTYIKKSTGWQFAY